MRNEFGLLIESHLYFCFRRVPVPGSYEGLPKRDVRSTLGLFAGEAGARREER